MSKTSLPSDEGICDRGLAWMKAQGAHGSSIDGCLDLPVGRLLQERDALRKALADITHVVVGAGRIPGGVPA
jgi:hypothetical protein